MATLKHSFGSRRESMMPHRFLITGGMGFIGQALCRELLAKGYEIRVIDSLVEQVHDGNAARPPSADCEFIHADLRDHDALKRALAGIHGVFHLAAEVGVGQSMYEIERYVGANEGGTAALLQALIDNPVERVVVASSMSVYGEGLYRTRSGEIVEDAGRDPERIRAGLWETVRDGEALEPVPTSEGKRINLASIYALTKYAQEQAVMIAAPAYEMQAVALRLFNVFGPGQALSNPYTGVLANFCSRLIAGSAPMIFEDGEQKRDFVHVDDVARAFRLAMETGAADREIINIGSGRSYTIRQVAEETARALGRDIEPEILNKARIGDVRHCFADIAKARDLLGFLPTRNLQDALPELADWVASQDSIDRGAEMRRHLESRGLVA
jgi:dTDP-L-rhamnose 4-epimerase